MVSLFFLERLRKQSSIPGGGRAIAASSAKAHRGLHFQGPRACPTAGLRQFKEMTSPQKQDEQRGARDHIQLARQPLASQAGDDPKPSDSATDAVASGDNSAALEAGSAARQDAFQESNAEAGGPASGNPRSPTRLHPTLTSPASLARRPMSLRPSTSETRRPNLDASRDSISKRGPTPTSIRACRSPRTFPSR